MESILAEPSDRRRRRTRAAVLAAARGLFARPRGYRSTSVDELAAAADVALTSIYSNFPGGKADVYAVLACRIAEEHAAAMTAAIDGAAPGADAARAVFGEYLDFHRREPGAFRILGLSDVHDVDGDVVRAARAQVRGVLTGVLGTVVDAIGEPRAPVRRAVLLGWAGVNGALALGAQGMVDADEAAGLAEEAGRRCAERIAELVGPGIRPVR